MNNDWIDIKKNDAHVKREREKARELRQSTWWKQALADGVCYYCGEAFAPSDLTMDHILPVVRGGKSIRSNCVPCCKTCNNEKKYLTPAEQIMREMEKDQEPGKQE